MKCFFFWHKWRWVSVSQFAYDLIMIKKCTKCHKVKKKTIEYAGKSLEDVQMLIMQEHNDSIESEIKNILSK